MPLSDESWADAQGDLGSPGTPTVLQSYATHAPLLADCENWEETAPTAAPSDPTEEFSDNDSMSVISGRSPNHPRTSTEDDAPVDVAALLDQAAARLEATVNTNCADMIATVNTNIDSMMNRLEKRMDDKTDTKPGLEVDRLTLVDRLAALENAVSSSTRSGPSSASDHGAGNYGGGGGGASPAVFAPSYLEVKGWCGFRDRAVHGLTEVQAKEFTTKLRAGIGADLDAMIARVGVGALRVRNTKIMITNCRQNQRSHEYIH